MTLIAILAFRNSISTSSLPSRATCYLPSRWWGGVLSRWSCCFCCSRNCSVNFLISRHSSVLWRLELCTEHCSPPSLLSEGWHGRLSLHGPRPPTSRCDDSSNRGRACQWLVVVGLLLHVLVLASALSSDICFGIAGLLWPRSGLGVPCTPFCWPSAFVRQVVELRDVFHLVSGQLLEHLLISHTLSKSDNDRSIGDAGDGVSILGELLDEGLQ
jgi:hypothetical protein